MPSVAWRPKGLATLWIACQVRESRDHRAPNCSQKRIKRQRHSKNCSVAARRDEPRAISQGHLGGPMPWRAIGAAKDNARCHLSLFHLGTHQRGPGPPYGRRDGTGQTCSTSNRRVGCRPGGRHSRGQSERQRFRAETTHARRGRVGNTVFVPPSLAADVHT